MTENNLEKGIKLKSIINVNKRKISDIKSLKDRILELEAEENSDISIQISESWMYTPKAEVNRELFLSFLNNEIARIEENNTKLEKEFNELGENDKTEEETTSIFALTECANSGYYCKKCNRKIANSSFPIAKVRKMNYCPYCGRKILGEHIEEL